MQYLRGLIELARVRHWVKSGFVLMPVPFALAAGASLDPLAFGLGLLGFTLGTSAVYAFNDVYDAERDRRHLEKRGRPVASGRVSERAALGWSAALLAGGMGLSFVAGHLEAVAILLSYTALNGLYTLGAKNVALLDVFLLSSGYVLRVLLGCALVAVAPSSWLLLCSSALALFLALSKRRVDLVKGLDDQHRPSLAGYNLAFLDQGMGITAGMTLIAYALYCIDAEVLLPGREFATLPFVVFAVLDYLRLVHVRGSYPVDIVLSSPGMILSGAGWVVAALWSVRLP